MRRFSVDDVEPANEPLAADPLCALYPEALAIGGDADVPVVTHGATHPVLAAVGMAFAQHRPLVLTPDAVWLTIAQGVAQHVRLNAERLRGRLVRHDGRKRLTLLTGSVPESPSEWAAAVGGFRALLAEEVGDGRARLFECNFSTSGEVERIASQIVLLDAYSPYFSFMMVAICGIPSITLTGTVDDWTAIRERIDVIAELDLEDWCRSLRPVADQFVRAARGDVDVAFWRRIYNPGDAYGGDVITGWVTRLYPYVEATGTFDRPNPMLALPIDEPKLLTKSNKDKYSGPGLRSSEIPATVSRVNVRVVDQRSSTHKNIDLVAGVIAVAQDEDLALRPIVGWRVENGTARIEDVLERIEHDHVTEPARKEERRFLEASGDVLAFYDKFERATLFAGDRAWKILAPNERVSVRIERGGRLSITGIAELPDGRLLCSAQRYGSKIEVWFACRIAADPPPAVDGHNFLNARRGACHARPSDIPVIVGTFATVLDAALEANGDISGLEMDRLNNFI